MHSHSIDDFRHSHVFLGGAHERNERRTWAVIAICAAMMVAEIAGGFWFGSVALMADGLHMSTHAGALLIAALAYTYSRRYAHDDRFAFGTGKLGDLAAFTSAIALAMIALLIGYESVERMIAPVPIAFNQAIPIAAVGLGVNLLSAYLLRDEHDHHHGHDHAHDHDHEGTAQTHTDHNLRAAFVHVMADAAVSVLVIVGLVLGRQFGWLWMDPLMGLIATVVILSWSWTLIRSAGADPARRLPRSRSGAHDRHAHRAEGRPHFRSASLARRPRASGRGHLRGVGRSALAAPVQTAARRPAGSFARDGGGRALPGRASARLGALTPAPRA